MKSNTILHSVSAYYTDKLRRFGVTHNGVDWNSAKSQKLRFDQLLRIANGQLYYSVLDYGCGYGAMARYMSQKGFTGVYTGYDVSPTMVAAARKTQSDIRKCRFISNLRSFKKADYVIASGIFNVKQDVSNKEWQAYVLHTIHTIASHSRKGFAFNILTSYSDKEKKRKDLYYGDPCFFIDQCVRNYSRNVAMYQDYGLYEFTIAVRLG